MRNVSMNEAEHVRGGADGTGDSGGQGGNSGNSNNNGGSGLSGPEIMGGVGVATMIGFDAGLLGGPGGAVGGAMLGAGAGLVAAAAVEYGPAAVNALAGASAGMVENQFNGNETGFGGYGGDPNANMGESP